MTRDLLPYSFAAPQQMCSFSELFPRPLERRGKPVLLGIQTPSGVEALLISLSGELHILSPMLLLIASRVSFWARMQQLSYYTCHKY